jgi:hypothetical protein
MSDLRLTFAANESLQIQDLANGRIRPSGIELTFLEMAIEENNDRFMHFHEWEISEASFGNFCASMSQPDPQTVALPIFNGYSGTARCTCARARILSLRPTSRAARLAFRNGRKQLPSTFEDTCPMIATFRSNQPSGFRPASMIRAARKPLRSNCLAGLDCAADRILP